MTPGGTLSLTLAAGDVRVVPVVQCLGMRPGEFLDMRATNTLDLAAPGRVDVQVSGIHHGPGQPANLFVSVIVGGPTSPVFMGNVPAAPVEILAEGAGRFSGVPIVNAAVGSPVFVYGQEYPITAEWRCAP